MAHNHSPESEIAGFPCPHLAVDLVLMTIDDDALHVLMMERSAPPFAGQLVLPGGFVHPHETLDDTARRVLAEKVTITGLAVEQLYTFSAPERDPRGWVVSAAYFALVPYERLFEAAGEREDLRLVRVAAEDAQLTFAGKAIEPGFDHGEIIGFTLARLRGKLDWSMVAFALLPERFTLLELQRVHELILGQSLNKPHFRKKVLAQTFADGRHLAATGEFTRGRRHRPAELYQLA